MVDNKGIYELIIPFVEWLLFIRDIILNVKEMYLMCKAGYFIENRNYYL